MNDMRTTITLEADVTAAVEALRREEGLGLSEAVNRLIRSALANPSDGTAYSHLTADLGLKFDVANIGEVLALLDET